MTNRDDATKDPAERSGGAAKVPGSERERDELRDNAGPQLGGGSWEQAGAADDDADEAAEPSELTTRKAEDDEDEADEHDEAEDDEAEDDEADAAENTGEFDSGGERVGVAHGEQPRKPKSEE